MRFDLIIKNGVIIDGTGAPPYKADIGVKGDTIAAIKDLSGAKAEKILDAKGLYVAPGFIDMHSHSDVGIFKVPIADNYIHQGVTTIVNGNCGYSIAPLTDLNKGEYLKRIRDRYPDFNITWETFKEYLEAVETVKPSVNIVSLVGHGAVRSAVLGFEPREPGKRDMKLMKEFVREAMQAGAYGMSTGLIYVPSMYGDTDEIIELARVVARYGGIYATHMRNEGLRLIDSIIEAITIGLKSGVSVEISHLKASGRPNWGRVDAALHLISDYIDRGYDISADAYPYTASSTSLSALLPRDIRSGSSEDILERLKDSDIQRRIRERLDNQLFEERFLSWRDVLIAYSKNHPEYEGKTLYDIAESLGLDPVDTLLKILMEDELATGMILFGMNEGDVEKVISHPYVAIGSDSSVGPFGEGKPHPRKYGTFPRVIARYVREKRLMSLPEAIRKMTSLPARKLGLWDRGIIRPGYKADITIFNYYTIEDTATYENPHSYPRGIAYVIVNGEVTLEEGRLNKEVRSGKVLRRR